MTALLHEAEKMHACGHSAFEIAPLSPINNQSNFKNVRLGGQQDAFFSAECIL
jgi:hypothetical protein